MQNHMPSQQTQKCMDECAACAAMCTFTAHHCLHLGGAHAAPEHQRLLHDCAEICAAAVPFMARSSPYAIAICRECAEICAACGDDCDRLADGEQVMARCAQTCKSCSRACESMSAAGV